MSVVVGPVASAQGSALTLTSPANTFTAEPAPVVSLDRPANGSLTGSSVTLSGFADRGVGSVTVKVYAGSVASGTPVATLVTPASGRVGGYSAKTTLADGTYTAQAQQTNDAGIVGYSGANTFTVDTTPPAVSLSSPTNGSYTGTQPRFGGSGGTQPDDSGSVTVKLYNGSTVTCCAFQQETTTVQADGSYSVASLVLGQGTYTARAQQSDVLGNVGFSSANTFIVDNPPVVSLTSPADGSFTNRAQPRFSGKGENSVGDAGSVTIKLYAGASTSGTPIQTLNAPLGPNAGYTMIASSALAPGTYTAKAQQSDASGAVGFSSANTFTVDMTPPVVSLTSPARGSTTNRAQPRFSGTGGAQPGDASSVTIKVYARSGMTLTLIQTLTAPLGPNAGYTMIASSRLASGTYSVQVQQSDAAGNVGYSGANTFMVDTTPPVVSLSSPTNGSFTGTRPQFSGMAGTHPGDLRSVTVKLWFGFNTTGGAWQKETATVQADGSYSVASLVLGHRTYTARAEQSDAVGNVGFSAPTTFTVDNP